MTEPFTRLAFVENRPVAAAVAACIDQLAPLPARCSLGFVFMGAAIAEDADTILSSLSAASGITRWFGAGGLGVIVGRRVLGPTGLAMLATDIPLGDLASFGSLGDIAAFAHAHAILLHADARAWDLTGESVRTALGARFSLGALLDEPDLPQIAGGIAAGGISGIGVGGGTVVVPLIDQGCRTLGHPCRVTSRIASEIRSLDDRPALQVIHELCGDLLVRSPEMLRRHIRIGEVRPGRNGYRVLGRLAAVNQGRQSIYLERDDLRSNEILVLCRDPARAASAWAHEVESAAARLDARSPVAVLVYASSERFQPGLDRNEELRALGEHMPRAPVLGLLTERQLFDGMVHEFACAAVVLSR